MSQVNVELNLASTTTISLNQTNVRTLAGVPTGTISMNNLRGKANTLSVEYLVVAGGGGGRAENFETFSYGGGGGAGGYRTGSAALARSQAFTVTVGAGGADGFSVGSNSTFNSLTSSGGGCGSGTRSGGSGAGGSPADNSAGAGTSGQGNSGGTGYYLSNNPPDYIEAFGGSGGGGGANAAGQSVSGAVGGAGGAGTTWSNGTTYAGGGGGLGLYLLFYIPGNYYVTTTYSQGAGGAGGGGSGSSGTANRGGGGSGGDGVNGYAGGSGVVVIRYAGTPQATGGTITQSGGYTYHTFNSSGTFTT